MQTYRIRSKAHVNTMREILQDMYNNGTEDVTLAAEGRAVKVHRFVLSLCSDLLRTLLADVPLGQEATIILPELDGNLLENFLDFIYLGETKLSASQFSNFFDAINRVGLKSEKGYDSVPVCALQLEADGALQMANNTLGDLQLGTEQNMDGPEAEVIITRYHMPIDIEPHHEVAASIDVAPDSVAPNESSSIYNEQEWLKDNVEDRYDAAVEVNDNQIIQDNSTSSDIMIEVAEHNVHIDSSNIITAPLNCMPQEHFSNAAIYNCQENTDPVQTMVDERKDSHTSTAKSKRHEVHMTSEGTLPPRQLTTDFDPYVMRKIQIDKAVYSCLNKGMSIKEAAKKYDLKYSSVAYNIRKVRKQLAEEAEEDEKRFQEQMRGEDMVCDEMDSGPMGVSSQEEGIADDIDIDN